jgi:class 3 adenylate cyclase
LKWELLTDLLPRPIANRLLAPVPVGAEAQLVADVYEDVTVLFTDMKGFTNFSSKLDPGALQHFLNGMFSAFDEILARWGLHKIEVIGDAYFVVSGAPSTNSNKDRTPDENAGFAAETALEMVRAVAEVCGDPDVRIRVGIHTGSVVGGVVGQKDPRFHLFGHTVDLANKMEEYGEPDKVHASMDTHLRLMRLQDQHLKSNPSSKPMFETEDRGMIEIAGQPEPVHTYFVHKSSFGREQRSKERRLGKAARGNDFFTANSSLKFLGSKNKQRSSILER